jgi:hypothetical protein
MAVPRTRCISTRVTADEYARIERLAGTRSVSLWLHDALATMTQDPRYFVLLAEIMALRIILLNTHMSLAVGQNLTDQRVHELIATADREKGQMATDRLAVTGQQWGRASQ